MHNDINELRTVRSMSALIIRARQNAVTPDPAMGQLSTEERKPWDNYKLGPLGHT